MVDIGVADEEIETDSRTSRVEDVICGPNDLHAVDESLQDVAPNRRLDHVAVLDSILRADELLQRGEVPYLSVPAHDFGIALIRFEAPPEHLVPRADVRRDRAAQASLDLLVVLRCRVLAEYRAFGVLVPSPCSGQHRGRIVVVPLGCGSLTGWIEVALLDAALRDGHAGHRTVRAALLGDDIRPVDPVRLAVEPNPTLRHRILVELEIGAIRPRQTLASYMAVRWASSSGVSRRSPTISPAFWSHASFPRILRAMRIPIPTISHAPTMNGDKL